MILLTKSRQSMSRSLWCYNSANSWYTLIYNHGTANHVFFLNSRPSAKSANWFPIAKTWFQLPSLIKTHHNCDWFSWEAHCDGNAPTFDARCFVENLYKRIEILVIRTAEHVSWRNTYSRTYKHMESMNCNICLALHCNCKVETWKHNTPGGTHHKHHQLLSDATLIGCKVIDSHGFSAVTWLELTPTKNSAMPTWAKKNKIPLSPCNALNFFGKLTEKLPPYHWLNQKSERISISESRWSSNCHQVPGQEEKATAKAVGAVYPRDTGQSQPVVTRPLGDPPFELWTGRFQQWLIMKDAGISTEFWSSPAKWIYGVTWWISSLISSQFSSPCSSYFLPIPASSECREISAVLKETWFLGLTTIIFVVCGFSHFLPFQMSTWMQWLPAPILALFAPWGLLSSLEGVVGWDRGQPNVSLPQASPNNPCNHHFGQHRGMSKLTTAGSLAGNGEDFQGTWELRRCAIGLVLSLQITKRKVVEAF